MFKQLLPRYRSATLRKHASGFTLIEVLVVMTIMITLATFGFAGVRDFAVRQSTTDAKLDFTSLLKLARSRAQTQVKPPDCGVESALDGYKVVLTCDRTQCPVNAYNTMRLVPMCGGTEAAVVSTKMLPNDITLLTLTPEFYFRTLSGNVEGISNESSITIQPRSGEQQTVTVYDDGRIEVDEE